VHHSATARWIGLILAGLVIPACSQGSGSNSQSEQSQAASAQVPDFHLTDLNPISATFNQTVSPRDFLGKTPAFYFTHAN